MEDHLPSNVPMRTLPSHHYPLSSDLCHYDGAEADSNDSESSWIDTGDIAEQLADDSDPVRKRLDDVLDGQVLAGYQEPSAHDRPHHRAGGINKEAIEIPNTSPRPVTRAERLLAAVMTGSKGSGQGLTGKPLMLVPTTQENGIGDSAGHIDVANPVAVISLLYSYPWASFCLDMTRASCRAFSRRAPLCEFSELWGLGTDGFH